MIKELRQMRAKGGHELALANYISNLQNRNKIGKYVSKEGYACFDTDELKQYRKTVKKGRPLKGETK